MMFRQEESTSSHIFHFCGEVYRVPSAKSEYKSQEQTEKELEKVVWFDPIEKEYSDV